MFRQKGIEVYESGYDRMFKDSLRDVDIGPGDMDALGKGMHERGLPRDAWMEYWSEADDLPETTEKPQELAGRAGRVITYLERIARTIAPNTTKRLHFICIGHEEGVRDLLEASLGQGTERDTGPTYGETVHVTLEPGTVRQEGREDTPAKLQVQFRGQSGSCTFDPKTRSLQST